MRAGRTVLARIVKIPLPTCGSLRSFLLDLTGSLGLANLRRLTRIGFSFFFNLYFLSFPNFIVWCNKLKQTSQSA